MGISCDHQILLGRISYDASRIETHSAIVEGEVVLDNFWPF